MAEPALFSFIALAFGLGMLHALDMDHLLTVSALSQQNSLPAQRRKKLLWFCTHWSFGHGLALLSVGVIAILLGFSLPGLLGASAELLVALILLGLGLWIFINPATAAEVNLFRVSHKPLPTITIGCLHGLAGSAPVLALIPISQMESHWQALIYLLIFAAAALLAMLLFGSVLSRLLRLANTYRLQVLIPKTIASACIVTGLLLLSGSLKGMLSS